MKTVVHVAVSPDTDGTAMIAHGVLEKLLDIFDMVAPEGMIDDADREDRLAVIEGIGQVKIALYRLFERSERRGHMPRWRRVGDGRLVLDMESEKTPQEQAESDARAKEMGSTGQAPFTPRWDGSKCHGPWSPAQGALIFDTKSKWEAFCKLNGKIEVGGSDLKGGGGGLTRPTAPATTGARETREETAAELLKKVLAKLEQGAPDKDLASIVPSAPRNGANGNGNGKDSILSDIDGQGGLDDDPEAACEEIPIEHRRVADTGGFEKRLWDHAVSKAMERSAEVMR